MLNRILSATLDWLFIYIVVTASIFKYSLLAFLLLPSSHSSICFLLIEALILTLTSEYWSVANRLLNLETIDDYGRRISFFRAVWRSVLTIPLLSVDVLRFYLFEVDDWLIDRWSCTYLVDKDSKVNVVAEPWVASEYMKRTYSAQVFSRFIDAMFHISFVAPVVLILSASLTNDDGLYFVLTNAAMLFVGLVLISLVFGKFSLGNILIGGKIIDENSQKATYRQCVVRTLWWWLLGWLDLIRIFLFRAETSLVDSLSKTVFISKDIKDDHCVILE